MGGRLRNHLWMSIVLAAAASRALGQESVGLEKTMLESPVPTSQISLGPGFPFWATLEAEVSPAWYLFAGLRPRPTEDHVLRSCVGGVALREDLADGMFVDLGSGAGVGSSDENHGATVVWNFLLSFQAALGVRLDDGVDLMTSVSVGVLEPLPWRSPGPVVSTEVMVGVSIRL